MSAGGSLDMPFEEHDPIEMDVEAQLSGGLVIQAATTPMPGVGMLPTLVFRFARPDGSGFYPPIALITNDDQLAKLRPVIQEAIATARRAAKASPTP